MTYKEYKAFRNQLENIYNHVCPFCKSAFITTIYMQDICDDCTEVMDKERRPYE
jgi:hypothetical protein